MGKGISVETIHFAHIDIVPSRSGRALDILDLSDNLNKDVGDILSEYHHRHQCSDSDVEVDPEFCCNILTEVGLRGGSLAHVKAVAAQISEKAENDPNLQLS